jgi:squalene-hopene/tetraprenyl-beta-curcumene cyclase
MESRWRALFVGMAFVLLATPRADLARAEDFTLGSWSPMAAAKYLDARADWWLSWSSAARGQGTVCVSCHTTMPFALARPALSQRLGEIGAEAAEKRLIENVNKRVANWGRIVVQTAEKDGFVPFYSNNKKPSALGTESVLNALLLVNNDAMRAKGTLSDPTKKALSHLWEQQGANGAWIWLDFGLRPWEKDGAYFGASLAALAVGKAGKDYCIQPELQPKLAALKYYLNDQFSTQPLHHRVLALWATAKLPGALSEHNKANLIEELISIQEPDGGWSLPQLGKIAAHKSSWKAEGVYPDGTISDGYATGLVVLALRGAGLSPDDAKLKKGLNWLASKQKDGTWPATYPNKARDPQENIGKFMRDAATAFAVLALTEPGTK